MATITISDKNYQYLTQRAQFLNSSPEAVLDELLETFSLIMPPAEAASSEEAAPPPIQTLGDLLLQGYGFWSDREDIEDSVSYAARLREEGWQRKYP